MLGEQSVISLIHRLAQQATKYPYTVWGYGEGIGLEGLLAAAEVTGEDAYFEFVHGLVDAWTATRLHIEYPDHVVPGWVLLEVYQKTDDQRLLYQAYDLAEFFSGLPRTAAGAALHRPDHPEFSQYVYVDCMHVDAPFLCRLARVTGESQFFHLAVDLLQGHIRVLQDKKTGLFSHLYDDARGSANQVFWGRGNGWAMLGLIETLAILPKDHPGRQPIQVCLDKQAASVVELQDDSGHWHTVLDHPDTYLETSLAAFFCTAFIHGVKAKILPAETFLPSALAAWAALSDSVDEHGIVQGVSQATPPSNIGDVDHYSLIPTGGLYPWGQGPALLATALQLTA